MIVSQGSGVTDKRLLSMVLGLKPSILFNPARGVEMIAVVEKNNITEDVNLFLLVTTNDGCGLLNVMVLIF